MQLAAVDAAQKSKSAPPPAGGGERIKAAAGQQPEPIALDAREARRRRRDARARASEREGLTSELKPISEFCNRAITGRYPFTCAARRPTCCPKTSASCSAPAAQLDDFYQRKLAALVDTGTNPWSFRPTGDGTKPVNAAALVDFQRAARIKEVFFRSGGKTPSFKVDIRAVEMDDGLKELALDIDGTVDQVRRRQHHAGDGHVAERARRVADQAVDGAGARPRCVFDGAVGAVPHVRPLRGAADARSPSASPCRCNSTASKARLEVTASSVFNPLRLREIQQFRCPGSL